MASIKVKERKVYGLNNFRGLDKENKPLKVSSFRASDGYNFIIDSDTLKTRPGFQYFKTPLLKEDGIEIIDFYKYGDIFVYVTNKGIKITYNDDILESPILITNILLEKDFSGLKPFFQEEKDCLFIFCLNDIYVVSKFYTNGNLSNVVLYPLNKKPNNPFYVDNSFFNLFEDLPIAYEPTLYIGNDFLEDVNLLSNVNKYELYAGVDDTKTKTYILPTIYDEKKHKSFIAEVEFYKNRFPDTKVFPVFLGKEDENFDSPISDYGAVLNDINPILIEDVFYAKETFEYKGEKGDANTTPIKEILGLTKKDFFKMKVDGSSQNVFEYVLSYVEREFGGKEDEVIIDDKVLKFELPYKREAYYRDSANNEIKKIYIEEESEFIYVLLKFKNERTYAFVDERNIYSGEYNEEDFNASFPNYEVFKDSSDNDIIPDKTKDFGTINKPYFKRSDFDIISKNWLEEEKNDFVNNYIIQLRVKYYSIHHTTISPVVTLSNSNEWFVSDRVDIQDDINFTDMPDYPVFDNSNSYPIFEYSSDYSIIKTHGQNVDLDNFIPNINAFLIYKLTNSPELFDNQGIAFCKFKWVTSFYDSQYGLVSEGQSVVVKFSYVKGRPYSYQRRETMSKLIRYTEDATYLYEDIFTFRHDEERNVFVLESKNLFYDFNNEPAISVKVTFQENPDYEIISNSRFGITFGSENRLFLAGNKEYPHIDRYNVSNDILGDNIKKQSYELTYFPSKNYRVLGGKGAINGYVLATDTQLYITKENYPNDQKVFIRNRTMDDNGLVGYNEFKTNIEKTPLNNNCIVRFYNDILVLDEKGLYSLEITSNILTNERLVKMRSGFINKELTKRIKDFDKNKVFIYEDNAYMYIFIDKKVYVADNRYIAQNPNSEIENYSYEIVEWDIPVAFKGARKIDDEIWFLDENGESVYKMVEHNDTIADIRKNYFKMDNLQNKKYFFGHNIKEVLKDTKGLSFIYYDTNVFKPFSVGSYPDLGHGVFVINNLYKVMVKKYDYFINIENGSIVYIKGKKTNNGPNVYIKCEVYDYSEDRQYFWLNPKEPFFSLDFNVFYFNLRNKKLYPEIIFKDYYDESLERVTLSVFEQEEVVRLSKLEGETEQDYYERVNDYVYDVFGDEFILESNTLKNIMIFREKQIHLKWVSAVLDFGNNISEKTMFKTNLYATKQAKENIVKLGYKTMRRYNRFDETGKSNMMRGFEVSNPFAFEEMDFNLFAINTLNEFGTSIPTKENNFLYIQFLVVGYGSVELNGIEIIYKSNRLLKTIG